MMLRKPIFIFLAVCASTATAQAPAKRVLHVTVTDPLNRFVTGLDPAGFEIIEDGVRRPVIEFSGVDSPVALAIVSATPLADVPGFNPRNDELIQTPSASDAIRQLSASKNQRKIMVISTALDAQAIPADIRFIQVNQNILIKAVIEARNEYLIQFEPAKPSASVEVVLQPQRGLPPLTVHINK